MAEWLLKERCARVAEALKRMCGGWLFLRSAKLPAIAPVRRSSDMTYQISNHGRPNDASGAKSIPSHEAAETRIKCKCPFLITVSLDRPRGRIWIGLSKEASVRGWEEPASAERATERKRGARLDRRYQYSSRCAPGLYIALGPGRTQETRAPRGAETS